MDGEYNQHYFSPETSGLSTTVALKVLLSDIETELQFCQVSFLIASFIQSCFCFSLNPMLCFLIT